MSDGVGRSVGLYAQLILVMALWGSAFATSKLAVDQVPPTVAALLRFGCGAVVLTLVAGLLCTRTNPVVLRDRVRAGLAGVIGVFAYNACFFWGLHLAPSIDGSIIVPVLSPIFTTVFAVLTRQGTASRVRVLGLGIGLAGAVVFFLGVRNVDAVGGYRLAGDLVFALAAACWATYTLVSPHVLADIDPLRATTYATVAGAALLAVLAVPDLGSIAWTDLPSGFWLNIAYLAVGPTAIAYVLYYRGISFVGSSNASTVMFAVPVFGAACSTLLLGESVSPVQAVGGVVMLIGAFLAVTQGRFFEVPCLRRWLGQPASSATGDARMDK